MGGGAVVAGLLGRHLGAQPFAGREGPTGGQVCLDWALEGLACGPCEHASGQARQGPSLAGPAKALGTFS